MKRSFFRRVTRYAVAAFGVLILLTITSCWLFGDDDSSEGAGTAGTGAAYGYMVFDYFGGSGGDYQTDLTLTADRTSYEDGTDPTFFMEFYDSTSEVAIETRTYQVVADASADGAAAAGNVLFARITRGASATLDGETVQELSFNYMGTNLSRAQLEALYSGVQTLSIGEYERITGGTVTVEESAGRYTFSWTLTTEDGDSIVGSYDGTVDLEEDSSSS